MGNTANLAKSEIWLTSQSAANRSHPVTPCFPLLCLEKQAIFRYYGATATRISKPPSFPGMAEPHVISALRLKRAEISGHIFDLEKRIARQRASLANLDATIKLFSPGATPDAIAPKRSYRRTRYFAHNELSRLTHDVLRTASGPLTSAEIAAAVMQAKGMPFNDAAFKEIVAARALTVLRHLAKRGAAVKHSTSRDAKWALARSALQCSDRRPCLWLWAHPPPQLCNGRRRDE